MENNEKNFQNQVNEVQKENGNNSNNSGNKKITVSLLVIILIFVLGIGICGGYLLSKEKFKTTNTTNTINNAGETKTGKKIDDNKPYVYDAEYVNAEGIKRASETRSTEYDIKYIPMINVNSEYANQVNEEIKKVYEEIYNIYGEKTENGEIIVCYTSYSKFCSDNIISVNFNYDEKTEDAFRFNKDSIKRGRIICNIDMNTLKEATFEQAYKECGYSSKEEVELAARKSLEELNQNNSGKFNNSAIDYDKYYVNESGLNFYIINSDVILNVPNAYEEKGLEVFSKFKGHFFEKNIPNKEYEGATTEFSISFNQEGRPGILVRNVTSVHTEAIFAVEHVYNTKSEVAAGTNNVNFDFIAWTAGGPTKGHATISWNDNEGKDKIKLNVNAYINGEIIEFTEKDFIELSKIEKESTSYFEENKNIEYTSNPKDDTNGKVAIIKMGEKIFQTKMNEGYYTYTDNFNNSYFIKQITNITSEYRMTSNDGSTNLFRAVIEYIDNNNTKKSFDTAVFVPNDLKTTTTLGIFGPYENYTGSTSFVRAFTNLYNESGESEKQNSNENTAKTNSNYAQEYIKIIDKVVAKYPGDGIKCDLIYFNNDDIPDLVIGLKDYWVSLYIYENGNVYNPIEEWGYGAMGNVGYDFLEKKAIVSNYNSDFAGAIGTWSILILNSNNEFDILSKRAEGALLESTDEMYEAVQKDLAETGGYYYNDKKISEEEYNNKLKDYLIDSNTTFQMLAGSKTTAEVKKELQK